MVGRSPTPDEGRLLLELARIAGIREPESWVRELKVQSMEDGGMGSLDFVKATRAKSQSGLVKVRAVVQFTDDDGVEVVATLYADEEGEPLELDVWKTDFSPLRRIASDFRRIEP